MFIYQNKHFSTVNLLMNTVNSKQEVKVNIIINNGTYTFFALRYKL